jgi:transposase-like protein
MSAAGNDRFDRLAPAAIASLLSLPTVEAAAKRIGVNERTLRRWLDRPDFQAQLRAARDQTLQHALNLLNGAAVGAVEVLKGIAGNKKMPPASRVRAANSILEQQRRISETLSTEQRLRDVERVLTERRASWAQPRMVG